MAGLLAAALGGAGEAVQTNAKAEIQKRKEAALMGLRQKYAMEQQQDQQSFTAGQNQADRQFRTEESAADREFREQQNQLDRSQRWGMAQMQEEGANSRALLRTEPGASPTSSMKEAQWLVQKGIAPDIQSAYNMVSRSSGDTDYRRQADRLDYLSSQLNAVTDQIQGYRDNFEDPPQALVDQQRQLMQQRESVASQLWGNPAQQPAPQTQRPAEPDQQRQQSKQAPPQGDDFDADAFLNDLGI